jgi:hypothetical protein
LRDEDKSKTNYDKIEELEITKHKIKERDPSTKASSTKGAAMRECGTKEKSKHKYNKINLSNKT